MTKAFLHRLYVACAAVALGAAAGACYAHPVDVVLSGTAHQAFFAVDFDGSQGIAVGSEGTVFVTEDGGRSWQPQEVPTESALLGVGIRGKHRVVVGQAGLILVRGADGQWQERSSGTEERLMNVDVNSDGLMVAVGGFGTMLLSRDAGENWSAAAPQWDTVIDDAASFGGFGPNLYAVDVADDGGITVAGEWGMVLRSADTAGSWEVLHVGDVAAQQEDATLFGMYVSDNGVIVAVGQEGAVMRSVDRGQSWHAVATESSANLLSVSDALNGYMVATGMRDMLISSDRGRNWQRVSGADIATGWYSGAAAPASSNTVYAVGHSGRILAIGMEQ